MSRPSKGRTDPRYTPLHFAALDNDERAVLACLYGERQDASSNKKNTKTKADGGKKKKTKVVVSHLLPPTTLLQALKAADSRGATALHLAAEDGRIEIIRILLEAYREGVVKPTLLASLDGGDTSALTAATPSFPNIRTLDGQTALHKATLRGRLEVVAALLKSGPQPSSFASWWKSAVASATTNVDVAVNDGSNDNNSSGNGNGDDGAAMLLLESLWLDRSVAEGKGKRRTALLCSMAVSEEMAAQLIAVHLRDVRGAGGDDEAEADDDDADDAADKVDENVAEETAPIETAPEDDDFPCWRRRRRFWGGQCCSCCGNFLRPAAKIFEFFSTKTIATRRALTLPPFTPHNTAASS